MRPAGRTKKKPRVLTRGFWVYYYPLSYADSAHRALLRYFIHIVSIAGIRFSVGNAVSLNFKHFRT
jgi:hypothetical protein